MKSFMEDIFNKAKTNPKKIVLVEGEDERVIEAASLAYQQGIAKPILVGFYDKIKKKAESRKIDLTGVEIVEPLQHTKFQEYVEFYTKMRGLRERIVKRLLSKSLNYGLMMVKMGDADGAIGGTVYTSAEFIAAAELIVGLKAKVPSSFFIMEIPGYKDGFLVFADCALNPDPSPEELAEIALATAESVRKLLEWEPRVALLSFSTKGSAEHPKVDKVRKAVEIAKRKAPPGVYIDGEFQADAAIVPEIAKRKVKETSYVAGKANVLIFPDLDAGNIAYKLVQWLANAKAYGPILQGFNKPVSDLSRGATVDDILGVIAIMTVKAQKNIG